MEQEEGLCVGCGELTTNTVDCNCGRAVFACAACCDSDASLRCTTCRERGQRQAVYPCLDFRGDPEAGRDMGGCLPVAGVVGAWGPPYSAV